MKKMSKEEAIKHHRDFWKWIADTTEKRQMIVLKKEYPYVNVKELWNSCFLCEYAFLANSAHFVDCDKCPLEWGTEKALLAKYGTFDCQCVEGCSPYNLWLDAMNNKDWISAVKYARKIAELPERKLEEEK